MLIPDGREDLATTLPARAGFKNRLTGIAVPVGLSASASAASAVQLRSLLSLSMCQSNRHLANQA